MSHVDTAGSEITVDCPCLLCAAYIEGVVDAHEDSDAVYYEMVSHLRQMDDEYGVETRPLWASGYLSVNR